MALMTIKEAAVRLELDYRQAQLLLSMGAIEGASLGSRRRIFSKGIEDYDKRGVRKPHKRPPRRFVCPGRGELFSCAPSHDMAPHTQRGVAGEKRRERAGGNKTKGSDRPPL
jgi:hypothetical protein